MQKKILHKIAALLLCCFAVCCFNKRNPFILSDVSQIQEFEQQDHLTCQRLHKSMDNFRTEASALYWRCRLATTKTKLLARNITSKDLEYNLKVSDLIRQIYLKLQETPEEAMIESNKKMDSRDHKKCLKMGFELETDDQIKVDGYFACRKILIEDQQTVPPFGNNDYKPYLNHSYNLSFVVNRRLDIENKARRADEEKYKQCLKFNIHSIDFANCKKAFDSSYQCYEDLSAKKSDKELKERLYCQRRAYIEFPDEMMLEKDRTSWEIKQENERSDYYNKNNFFGIGIEDLSSFGVTEEELKKVAKKPESKNSKAGLYTKVELSTLRRKYIISCNKDADRKIFEYIENTNTDCESLKKFKIHGED